MSRIFGCLLGLVLILAGISSPRAEVVQGLYAADVPVTDQSAKALADAAREGLSEVLVKVSGSTGVLRNPVIAAALPRAKDHVLQYSYGRDDSAGGLVAQLEFDRDWVSQLMTEAGAPLWTANRPVVLVWLVAEEEGERRFVNPESSPALTEVVLDEFARRGVPAQLPLYDLADTAGVSTDRVWGFDVPRVNAASDRYGVQDVLVGRMAPLTDGSVAGDWLYLQGGERNNRSLQTPDPVAFIRGGVALVAEAMAGRYAVAPAAMDPGGIPLSVSGVTDYAQYASVVSWLQKLELVDSADLERVQGDTIHLRLQARADPGQLAVLIELNEWLQPAPGAAAGSLSYQWRPRSAEDREPPPPGAPPAASPPAAPE